MTARSRSLAIAAPLALLTLVALHGVAAAKDHPCPRGQTWSQVKGACEPMRAAPPRSPQRKYDDAVADLLGNGAHPDPKRGVATLQDNCAHGSHPASCTLLGFLYARGREVKVDSDLAMTLFVKGCGLGDLDGCFQVGDLAYRLGKYADARTAYVHACGIGSGLACVKGGDAYNAEVGGLKSEPATAQKLYQAGLALFQPKCPGDGSACYALGYLYENGAGVAKDPAAAVTAYRNGCVAGSGEGCVALGTALESGLGGAVDKAGANAAFTTGCETDDNADACQKIAERLGQAKTDLPHALQMATRACELDAKNCGTLGEFYRIGLGTTADQPRATSYYVMACDAGYPRWCTSLGERQHEGLGMTADPAAGIASSVRACQAGDGEGCRQAAGYLAVSDPKRAADLSVQGCSQGDPPSCDIAGDFMKANKQLDDAKQLYDRACENSFAQGCIDAAAAYADDAEKSHDRTQKACLLNDAKLSGPPCEDLVRIFYFGTPKNAESAMYAAARACALGRPEPCDWLGQLSGEVPGDHADLRTFLETACSSGTDGACGAQATLLLRGTEADKKAALALLDKTCARDVASACMMKANALYSGTGALPDKAQAEKLFETYCNKGNAQACSNMAIIANERKDYEHAMMFAKRACETGSPDGCNELGYFYFTAKGTRWNAPDGVAQWQKACELGSAYGCSNMGYMYRYGVVVPKDGKKALEAYEKSCTPTEQIGCQGAAHFYETGEGGTKVDTKKAADAYRSACESKADPVAIACSDLAAMLERLHQGSAPEISRLREEAFHVAQDKAPNNPYASWMLGTYYRDGVATMKDPAKARTWFAKACEEYDPLGCLDAGKAFLATGAPADAELARSTYLERACGVGMTEACELKTGGGKGGTPGAGVHAKGCGCQGGADGSGLALLGVGALVLRRRRRT